MYGEEGEVSTRYHCCCRDDGRCGDRAANRSPRLPPSPSLLPAGGGNGTPGEIAATRPM